MKKLMFAEEDLNLHLYVDPTYALPKLSYLRRALGKFTLLYP